MQELNQREDTINKHQLLFGINQGAIYEDIRIDHAKRISEMDLDGYAVGGLAERHTRRCIIFSMKWSRICQKKNRHI